MTDENILQGPIFHEDIIEDMKGIEIAESKQAEVQKGNGENRWNPLEKPRQLKDKPKPAAHRLYRLAKKKKQSLYYEDMRLVEHYVNRKGLQHYFKSYSIPEDLVPLILSSAYFHHYSNVQPLLASTEIRTNGLSLSKHEEGVEKSGSEKPKENEGEQLVMGLCPVQSSF
ncbi:hypothetical protein WN944_026663 [Citrus x changshan-huyou]|uniref:Uncharacterized protein n=1 Tax=Citrus x changshan-huyou TaxID=2935761 RepID=A0AAP0LYF8_9ROSI